MNCCTVHYFLLSLYVNVRINIKKHVYTICKHQKRHAGVYPEVGESGWIPKNGYRKVFGSSFGYPERARLRRPQEMGRGPCCCYDGRGEGKSQEGHFGA